MACPKKKCSRTRRDRRRSQNWKINVLASHKCSHCGVEVLPHQICGHCGYYGGRKLMIPLPDQLAARRQRQKDRSQQASA